MSKNLSLECLNLIFFSIKTFTDSLKTNQDLLSLRIKYYECCLSKEKQQKIDLFEMKPYIYFLILDYENSEYYFI